jgi:DNA repair exonuclease SbcCD ATPase subunit
MDADEHYKLLQKGGDACPTCKQPLSFILDGMTPQEKKVQIEAKIKEIQDQEKKVILRLAMHSSVAKVEQQYAILKEQFARFPTFGLKLSEAEAEVENVKRVAKHWKLYEKELELETQWQTKHDLLMVEAESLGYPDILNDDFSAELNTIKERLPIVTEELKQFDRFDALADHVINQPSYSALDDQLKECKEELTQLLARVETLNELKGVLRTQLVSITTLKAQAEALEKKLVGQEETESECKILELLNNFYSPTGFKVYELKRRCQKLIERANYWSKLFFQEPYEWSLSDDLENLDFFIQPTQDRDTDPYPIALLSSGEFNRAARVLLFSQLELIPPSKKTNILFLDEIEGNLDDAGMTAFCEVVLPKLKETFPDRTIVVISHQSSLQNSGVLDHVWLAERKDRKTALTVYPDYHRRKA